MSKRGWSGGQVVQWCWVNFQCRGVLLIWMSRARAYCACSGCGWGLFGHFYSRLPFLFSFSFSLGDGLIQTEILSHRAIKPKTPNQPKCQNIDGTMENSADPEQTASSERSAVGPHFLLRHFCPYILVNYTTISANHQSAVHSHLISI